MPWYQYTIVLPLALTSLVFLVWNRHQLQRNRWVLLASVLLSIGQAHPAIQAFYTAVAGGPDYPHGHAMAVFLPMYLVFGKFRLPSLALTFAWTFLTLLATDLAIEVGWRHTGAVPPDLTFVGIGGAGFGDGLLWIPVLSVLVVAFARYELKRGKQFRWMIGNMRVSAAPLASAAKPG